MAHRDKDSKFDSLSVVMMSHINDLTGKTRADDKQSHIRGEFLKFLVMKYVPQTFINADSDYEEFKTKVPHLFEAESKIVSKGEKTKFINYVLEHYGERYSLDEIMAAVNTYIKGVTEKSWGGGDSVDRERVLEILEGKKMEAGGGIADKFAVVSEQVKARVMMAIGLDRALAALQHDYVVNPYTMLNRLVYGNLLLLDEINENVWRSALAEAESIDEDYKGTGHGIGSSDMTYFIKRVLDDAGLKCDFIQSKLERVDDKGNVIKLENKLPATTMFEKGGKVEDGEKLGFFSNDGTEYVNLGVGKSSPNRKGKVIGLHYSKDGEGNEYEWARVKFRDLEENIRFNRDEAKDAPYLTFSPKGLTKLEIKFLKTVEKMYLDGADVNTELLQKALDAINFKKGQKGAAGIVDAWDYWKALYRPMVYRDSYKNPKKLSSLITMTTKDAKGRMYITVRNHDIGGFKSGYCHLATAVWEKLDLLKGLTTYLEIVNDFLYIKYDQIIGGTCIAKIINDVPELQLAEQMEKGGSITKEAAIKAAEKEGVDFDKDFYAQSAGGILHELAIKAGYRKPKNANGSRGRYFFYYLKKLRDKENKNKPKWYATYNEYGYEIWSSDNDMKYSAGNSPFDSQQTVSLEDALPLKTIKEFAEQTGKEMAEEAGAVFTGVQYEAREDEVMEKGGGFPKKLPCVIISKLKDEHGKSLKGKFGVVEKVDTAANACEIIIGDNELMNCDIEDFAVAGVEVTIVGDKKHDKGMVLSFDPIRDTVELYTPSGDHIHRNVMLLGKVIDSKPQLLEAIEKGKLAAGGDVDGKEIILG